MEGSAFLGQPPRTQDDYYIAKGFLRLLGLLGVDAHMGLPVDPPRPPPNRYHFETRGPGMTAGASVSIAIMIFVTVTRLCLRYFRPRLIWGWDDWLIIPGVVGDSGREQTILREVDAVVSTVFRRHLGRAPDCDHPDWRGRETLV